MKNGQTGLRTGDAARLLEVTPNTLRSWERRYNWPPSVRSAGGHRLFNPADIEALSPLLKQDLSISSAIAQARESSDISQTTLRLSGALENFDRSAANRLMEKTMSVQSAETALQEVLLPSVRQVGHAGEFRTAAWSFAGKWACDWMSRATNFLPDARRGSIVVGNANNGELNQDALEISAFEVFVRRLGFEVIDLSVEHHGDAGQAVDVINPISVILAGDASHPDATARWSYNVQAADQPITHLFRHERPKAIVPVLPADPYLASQELA